MATLPQPDDHARDEWADNWIPDSPATTFLNSLAASTEAEHEMHVVARAALLNLLVADPTVDALYWRWMHQTTFGRSVFEFVEHLDRTAKAVGLANAAELLRVLRASDDGTITVDVADEADVERVSHLVNDAVAEADRLAEALIAACEDLDTKPLTEDAITLVRDEWQLPWPWLAWELGCCWMIRMTNIAFGTHSTINFWVEADEWDRPAPAIDFHFETKPGETVKDAALRFRRAMRDAVIDPLHEAAAPLPKGRVTDHTIVTRYVEWWYRRRILQESVRSIADKDDNKRRHVRYGIAQAERWLSVPNCVWKDDNAA